MYYLIANDCIQRKTKDIVELDKYIASICGRVDVRGYTIETCPPSKRKGIKRITVNVLKYNDTVEGGFYA